MFYAFLRVLMVPYGSLLVLSELYKLLWVVLVSNGCLWVFIGLIGPYSSLWVLIGLYRS